MFKCRVGSWSELGFLYFHNHLALEKQKINHKTFAIATVLSSSLLPPVLPALFYISTFFCFWWVKAPTPFLSAVAVGGWAIVGPFINRCCPWCVYVHSRRAPTMPCCCCWTQNHLAKHLMVRKEWRMERGQCVNRGRRVVGESGSKERNKLCANL